MWTRLMTAQQHSADEHRAQNYTRDARNARALTSAKNSAMVSPGCCRAITHTLRFSGAGSPAAPASWVSTKRKGVGAWSRPAAAAQSPPPCTSLRSSCGQRHGQQKGGEKMTMVLPRNHTSASLRPGPPAAPSNAGQQIRMRERTHQPSPHNIEAGPPT